MSTILVLGATGKTGRRTTRALVAGGHAVRGGARTPEGQGPDIEAVRFDWDDPATHAPALEGVDAVYVIPPALRVDFAPLLADFFTQAVGLGVRRAVLLSARGAEQATDGAIARAEQALRATVPEWGVVRPTWFNQNFTENFFRPPIEDQGVLVAPAGDGREPFVDAEDIAAVAAAILTDASLTGEAYDLSGPEAITFAEAAELLGAAARGTIGYVDADPAEWQQGLVGAGVPAEYGEFLGGLFALIRSGGDAHLSDGVQRALGREPRSFADWAQAEARELRVGAPR